MGWTIGVLGFDSRWGLGIYLFPTASRTALGPTQPPIQWAPGAPSLWVKRPGREANHSPPSSAEVKMRGAIHPLPQNAFMAWCSVEKKAEGQLYLKQDPLHVTYEVVSKSFRTRRLERELQMVQLSTTSCSCIAILWVSLVSFVAITLCVVSQRIVYFVIDSVWNTLVQYREPENMNHTAMHWINPFLPECKQNQ
jgi:hypothetical protein